MRLIKPGWADAEGAILTIALHEPLDYQLLKSAVHIIDGSGNELNGTMEVSKTETLLHFIPANAWAAGEHSIEIEPRLEDLAGNNLDRLFDRDLSKNGSNRKTGVHKRKFYVNSVN